MSSERPPEGEHGDPESVLAEIDDVLDIIQTPQFERADGVAPADPPLTTDAMDRIKRADESELKELGLRKWSDESGLWLLPHEWHPHLPPDYDLVTINDERTSRSQMSATPDKRFGVLSAGIVPDFEKRNVNSE